MKDTRNRRLIHSFHPMDSIPANPGIEKDIKAKGEKIIKIQSSISRLIKLSPTIKKAYAA